MNIGGSSPTLDASPFFMFLLIRECLTCINLRLSIDGFLVSSVKACFSNFFSQPFLQDHVPPAGVASRRSPCWRALLPYPRPQFTSFALLSSPLSSPNFSSWKGGHLKSFPSSYGQFSFPFNGTSGREVPAEVFLVYPFFLDASLSPFSFFPFFPSPQSFSRVRF